MRTTVTFDPDVASQIELLRMDDARPFKEIVNELLRTGLAYRDRPAAERQGPFTKSVHLGRPLLPNVDDISEVLAIIEGEDHR